MEISAVKLRNSYQMCYVDCNNLFIKGCSMCILETEHGIDIGKVVKKQNFSSQPGVEISGKIIRKVTDEDIKKIPEIESIEKKAFETCREKATGKGLDMKLISVKCLFDKTKIIFFFVADNRIDFRELVRELASIFRTRIEMRQIGVRDEARLVGGFGQCGREYCCGHQKDEFDPVSIKMAKEQNLNLNSLKISGMCGRLLCCLGYEYNVYKELNREMPKPGAEIKSSEKSFSVESVDTINEQITVRDGDRVIKISKNDIITENGKYTINTDAEKRIFSEEEAVDEFSN